MRDAGPQRACWAWIAAGLLPLAACDNIGRAFDPNKGGGGSTGPGTGIQAAASGGNSVNGKPRVDAVFPEGAGWPSSVPIVVVFSESVAQDTVAPPSGSTQAPGLFVRAPGTTTALPASYDFLLGDQVVVIRPLTPLPAANGLSYEVVVDPALTDADGVRYGGTQPVVLAQFATDEDSGQPTPGEDGRILTVLPVDRERDAPRESEVYAIFTRAANRTSVTNANFVVRDSALAEVPGQISFPLGAGPLVDGRVLRFDPTAALAADTDYEIVVDATITFGNAGELNFGNRTPFARFHTLPFSSVAGLAVGNAVPGFPDRVNQVNLDNLMLDATVDGSAAAGDTVTVRLYGLDRQTQNLTDLNFVERSARLPVPGAQTIAVDFAGALGNSQSPRFADGDLTIAAQLVRGTRRAGYTLSSSQNQPRLDLTPPTLRNAGPPASNTLDLLTDQTHVAFYGQANEQLGAATLTVNNTTITMFASDAGGGFLMLPFDLALGILPLPYTLAITDAGGNLAPIVYQGNIIPRGVVTGSAAGGDLTVEVYDDTTLLPIAGATVLVEPGLPQKPMAGQTTATTAADGRVAFTGLTQARSSITVAASGYDLRTLLDTGAGFVSLALRPRTNATATFSGTAAFLASAGQSVLVGNNALDDPLLQGVLTTTAAPTAIPATAIRPNRPQALTGFAATFEPNTVPAFGFAGCRMCGLTGATPSAPSAPVAPGASGTDTITLLPIAFNTLNLATPYVADFSQAAGLDLGNLTGAPTVRIVGSLRGFAGMTLFGVGFAAAGSGGLYTINGTYSLTTALTVASFAPVLFASTEATDQSGNVSRHRALLDNTTGLVFPILAPPAIPTITPPGGPSVGAPAVVYEDRLDGNALGGSLAFVELTAIDPTGRRWVMLRQDLDGAVGQAAIQWPDLAAAGVTGLVNGIWSVRTEAHRLLSTVFAADHYVLEEIRRQQAAYARAATVNFTVQ